jgi:hypothetical protein
MHWDYGYSTTGMGMITDKGKRRGAFFLDSVRFLTDFKTVLIMWWGRPAERGGGG